MGRTGIGAHAIHEAATKLQAKGRTPTVDGVRELLGTGSKTTIAAYLRDWKAEQGASLSNLPLGLQKAVSTLWESLQIHANERIDQYELQHKTEKIQWQAEMAHLRQEKNDLTNRLHQAEDDKILNQQRYQALEEKHAKLHEEQTILHAQHQANCQLLENTKADKAKLHQLVTHIQNNLEHYQYSIQELHTKHALDIEKQQAQSQQEIQALQTTLSSAKEALYYETQKMLESNRILEQLKLENKNLHDRLQNFNEMGKNVVLFEERHFEQNKKIEDLNQTLMKKEQKLIEVHSQLATLNQTAQELASKVSIMDDTIEKLRHEKLFLVQEKSELIGQMKQLEKMLDNNKGHLK